MAVRYGEDAQTQTQTVEKLSNIYVSMKGA